MEWLQTNYAYLTKISFSYVVMQIPNIQPSGPSWIGAYKPTWYTSHCCSWLDQILFCFWWFYHNWLTKKRKTRECYCHRDWHCIIELNITANRNNFSIIIRIAHIIILQAPDTVLNLISTNLKIIHFPSNQSPQEKD